VILRRRPVAFVHETLVPDQFRRVLTFLRTAYDWILLDLGGGVNALSLGMLSKSTDLYLVATSDIPRCTNASRWSRRFWTRATTASACTW